jgi:hypothetical protein
MSWPSTPSVPSQSTPSPPPTLATPVRRVVNAPNDGDKFADIFPDRQVRPWAWPPSPTFSSTGESHSELYPEIVANRRVTHRFLNANPKNPKWFNRDRFVLSNGYVANTFYD